MFDYLYLKNLDHHKCVSILQSLNYQKSLETDQYRRIIVETNNVLSNHKFDINKNQKQYHKQLKSNKNNEDKEVKYYTPILFLQMEGKCYFCGKPGQTFPDCSTKKKITKYEWEVNKA